MHDVVDDVRHHVGGGVGGAQALGLTVCANTTCRPNPITRASMVIAPISTAARPIPPTRCRALPRSATGAVTLPAGLGRYLQPNGARCHSRRGLARRPRRCRARDQHRPAPDPRAAAAQHVQPAQGRRALDDLGEADLLAGGGQPDDPGQQRDPGRPRQPGRGGAEHGAQRVRPAVAEHGPLAQVLGQQRQGRRQRRQGQAAAAAARRLRPADGCRRAPRPRRSARRRRGDLDRPARAQVEQVEQVGAAGDQPGVDHHVGGRAPGQRGAGDAGGADAAQLDRAGGDLAVPQGAEVAAEPAPVPRARQVVVGPERRRARRRRPPWPGLAARPAAAGTLPPPSQQRRRSRRPPLRGLRAG